MLEGAWKHSCPSLPVAHCGDARTLLAPLAAQNRNVHGIGLKNEIFPDGRFLAQRRNVRIVGIAVSNTSADGKGTTKQRGRSMVHYIGNVVDDGLMPDTATSSIIEGGEQMMFTLAEGNPVWSIGTTPDFQGFLMIMCEFQFAHG